MKKLRILFQGNVGNRLGAIAKRLGYVTPYENNSSVENYDLICLDGNMWNVEDLRKITANSFSNGAAVSITDINENQLAMLYEMTGLKPSFKAFGALLSKYEDSSGNPQYLARFIPEYSQQAKDLLISKGILFDDFFEKQITRGIVHHFYILEGKQELEGIPMNHMIPPFTKSPFGMYTLHEKQFKANNTGMKNLNSLSMTASTDFYCYHENAKGKNTFWVAGITKLTNVNPASALHVSETESVCCAGNYFYDWQQSFNYSAFLTPLDENRNPLSYGVQCNKSSPVEKGCSPSIPVELQFQIFIHVNDSGTYRDVYYDPFYKEELVEDKIKYFEVKSLDDILNKKSGTSFNMPHYPDHTGSASDTVNFQIATLYTFDGDRLIKNNKLPVIFKLNYDLYVWQEYTSLYAGGEYPSWPITEDTDKHNTFEDYTDIIDLVQLTAMK